MRPALLYLVLAGAACSRDPSRSNTPMDALPIDAKVKVTPAEALTWGYHNEIEADLDGDGSAETVVLAADVSVSSRGVPLWEDGHRWALVVEDDQRETLLYAAFVPNGFAEAAIMQKGSDGKRQVLVQQRTPGDLRAFEIAYDGPAKARSSSAAYYSIERWLPGAAALPEDVPASSGRPIRDE